MNSMFSSFDAFSAELMGQKVRVSFAPTTTCSSTSATATQKNNLQSQESTKDVAINNKNKKPSTSSSSKPRFALELDGLNCFETLVYY
ncbi:hypothetical protein Ddye_002972 [Dipteronia dyeriana]|uniref:Avr9/Cf-9 rapidly elicited protein n=1 Tax=Dipteronia dyeriana TaxID=168575 RepID=A0AAD9XS31_9ROSI|nr:hypothetical protein Ddye_002972 [Dipteronia dyeriana]